MAVHNGVAVHRSTRFLMGQSFSKATRLVGLAAVKFLRTWRDGFTSRPTAERHGALERWMGRGRYVSSCFSTRRWTSPSLGVCAVVFLSPLRGLLISQLATPTACAVGCILSPLRGLEGTWRARRNLSYVTLGYFRASIRGP